MPGDPLLARPSAESVLPTRGRRKPDGRIRFWGQVSLAGETRPRILRVVTLADGETVHNAFFDRNFREDER